MSCRCCMSIGKCTSTARLDGKTVIITGANTGIGLETAKDIASRGARVILACRDVGKAETAANQVRTCASGDSVVIVKRLDLASMKSIRDFAKDILDTEDKINILINNAGIMLCPELRTEDNFEMQFGVNHLGHFLLTNLLLDRIKTSTPARIVTVSSVAHQMGKINFKDINSEKSYSSSAAYGQSKLANILFTLELMERLKGTGVTVYSLHPGAVSTELGRHVGTTYGSCFGWLTNSCFAPLFCKTPEEGAQTTIYCAVDEKLEGVSDLYYSDCKPKTPTDRARDKESAKKLWELSEQMVGLKVQDQER